MFIIHGPEAGSQSGKGGTWEVFKEMTCPHLPRGFQEELLLATRKVDVEASYPSHPLLIEEQMHSLPFCSSFVLVWRNLWKRGVSLPEAAASRWASVSKKTLRKPCWYLVEGLPIVNTRVNYKTLFGVRTQLFFKDRGFNGTIAFNRGTGHLLTNVLN